MTYIINESKRDDLLLPYFEKVKAEFPDLTLGKFKGMMLDKLAAQGSIHNLSLSSNYYLAGATKYYFNGDLTKDHKTHFGSTGDIWDTEICKRLNAVILILRDAYIDSIGTTFEQPEDFGTLSLPKLLRKYGKKIDAVLGVQREVKKKETPQIDTNPRVGNGYTFDILYRYDDATKYNTYTAPGSWCITYADYHFNSYIKRLGIHYVIFLKDGYQNVQRPPRPVNKRKPHDEYGNSMIAVLQSNRDWHPVYITSRWNHGYGESSGTEADHAYTEEEFMRITGVTPEDLKRIYKIWDMNREKGTDADRAEANAAKKRFIHLLKYAQMRINGGEDPRNFFVFNRRLFGNPDANDLKKWVCEVTPMHDYFGDDTPTRGTVDLIFDRGNIVFDAIAWGNARNFVRMSAFNDFFHNDANNNGERRLMGPIENFVISEGSGGYTFYDTRRKQVLSIDGVKKFKYIPDSWAISSRVEGSKPALFQVKNSSTTSAFIDVRTGQPLRLPNGEYWFNYFRAKGYGYHRRGGDTKCYIVEDYVQIIEVVYDASSNEKYFYSIKTRSWVQMPSSLDAVGIHNLKPLIVDREFNDPDYVMVKYTQSGGETWNDNVPKIVLNGNNLQQLSMGGFKIFDYIEQTTIEGDKYFAFTPFGENKITRAQMFDVFGSNDNKKIIYDVKNNYILKLNGKYLMTSGFEDYGNASRVAENKGILAIEIDKTEPREGSYGGWYYRNEYSMYYDPERGGILLNPTNFPSKYVFKPDDNSSGFSKREYEHMINRNAGAWDDGWGKDGNIAVFIHNYESSQWGENYFNSEERRKAVKILNLKELAVLPLDPPSQEQTQIQQPAYQIRESDIVNLVKQALNEIYGRIIK